MRISKPSFVACAGVLFLAAGFSLLTPNAGLSQPQVVGPDKPVLIINSPSEPVPVNVVSETPLAVTASTKDVDQPARSFLTFEFGTLNSTYIVPDGKILVIDWVSSFGGTPGSVHILEFQGETTHGTDSTRWTSYFSINQFGSVNEQVRLYAKGGQTITWRRIGTTSSELWAQGHLLSAE